MLKLRKRWRLEREMWLLAIIPVAWVILFSYVPMYGLVIAFMKYIPGAPLNTGKWVGLLYFQQFFSNPEFPMIMRNTLVISGLQILLGFPAPIILALLFNELRKGFFKRFVQTVSYLPHFISWVVTASIVFALLGNDGFVNMVVRRLGGESVNFLGTGPYFWWIITLANIWKGVGWASILYLSAIAGIDEELYQAGKVDGLNDLGLAVHITVPGIMPTIMLLFILGLGGILNAGFEQQLLLGNAQTRNYYEVIDTYAYKYGIQLGQYSFGTAVALVKSAVGLGLVLGANRIAKKVTDMSIF
jgi:putative aldouronate transport system permease protein